MTPWNALLVSLPVKQHLEYHAQIIRLQASRLHKGEYVHTSLRYAGLTVTFILICCTVHYFVSPFRTPLLKGTKSTNQLPWSAKSAKQAVDSFGGAHVSSSVTCGYPKHLSPFFYSVNWKDHLWNRGGGLRHYVSPTYNTALSSLLKQLNNHSHQGSHSLTNPHDSRLGQQPTSGRNDPEACPHVPKQTFFPPSSSASF